MLETEVGMSDRVDDESDCEHCWPSGFMGELALRAIKDRLITPRLLPASSDLLFIILLPCGELVKEEVREISFIPGMRLALFEFCELIPEREYPPVEDRLLATEGFLRIFCLKLFSLE